jgi:hypothetical protein
MPHKKKGKYIAYFSSDFAVVFDEFISAKVAFF